MGSWDSYGLKKSKDKVRRVRDEMFRMMVDGIDCKNGIFPNI